MNNVEKFVGRLFLFIGFMFFSIALIFGVISPQSFMSNSTEVTGTITDIKVDKESYRLGGKKKVKVTHHVYVDYYIDDMKYSVCVNSYTSSMHVGDDIKLYVDNDDFYNVRVIRVELILGVIFLLIGLVLLLIGLYLLVQSRKVSSISDKER